ncbi:MAG TPA: SdpI family protein [Polyangiaceae bacterium]
MTSLDECLVLPRLRRNPLVGIRTAWTLTSDENWSRVHRLGSYVYAATGLACLACGLVGATAVGLVVLTTGALAPGVYSYVLASRLPPEA